MGILAFRKAEAMPNAWSWGTSAKAAVSDEVNLRAVSWVAGSAVFDNVALGANKKAIVLPSGFRFVGKGPVSRVDDFGGSAVAVLPVEASTCVVLPRQIWGLGFYAQNADFFRRSVLG